MNRDIRTGLITAGLMISGSLILVGLQRAGLVHGDHGEMSTRWVNVLIGLMTVGFASNGAKQLRRRLVDLRDPAREQALRRFSAWTLSAGALLYALVWIVVPYAFAAYIAIAALGGAALVVVGRCIALRTRHTA